MYPWLCSWREGGMASISSPQHSLHSQPLRAHVARLAVGSFCTYQPCWGLPCSRLLHALSSLFCREMRTAHIHCRGWEGSHEKWQPAAVPPKPPLPAGGGGLPFSWQPPEALLSSQPCKTSCSSASGELKKKSLFTSTYITLEKQGRVVTAWEEQMAPALGHSCLSPAQPCPTAQPLLRGATERGTTNSAAVSNLTEPSLKEFKGNLA